MNPKIDAFMARAIAWKSEMEKLRSIVLSFPLTEEMKWGKPCYAVATGNVVIIVPFKECCALLFAKGGLLDDPKKILVRPTENTQAARQMRFTSLEQIVDMEGTIRNYLQNAIDVENAGLEVDYSPNRELTFPEEFITRLEEDPELKAAFDALTPGRQRSYYLHFSAPKQSKTRESRIEKCIPQILEGRGFNER